jgi:hypothetical protein
LRAYQRAWYVIPVLATRIDTHTNNVDCSKISALATRQPPRTRTPCASNGGDHDDVALGASPTRIDIDDDAKRAHVSDLLLSAIGTVARTNQSWLQLYVNNNHGFIHVATNTVQQLKPQIFCASSAASTHAMACIKLPPCGRLFAFARRTSRPYQHRLVPPASIHSASMHPCSTGPTREPVVFVSQYSAHE